jgi:hypothetical protein
MQVGVCIFGRGSVLWSEDLGVGDPEKIYIDRAKMNREQVALIGCDK